jgi:ribA/ribD-fused uncharacterized protein
MGAAPVVVEGITRFSGPYAFLSNFHPSPLSIPPETITYPTAEHAFQAFKTLNTAERRRIAGLPTPGAAKGAGRHVDLREDWERLKKQVMLRVVLAKFARNPDLAEQLCATGKAPLLEGNDWHDNYWGDCRCGRPSCGHLGGNYLGQILMAARLVLRAD